MESALITAVHVGRVESIDTLHRPLRRLADQVHASSAFLAMQDDAALTTWLYESWYTRPDPASTAPTPWREDVSSALRAHVPALTRWEPGWVVVRTAATGACEAGRDGRLRRLYIGQYANLARPGAPVSPGDAVAVPPLVEWIDEQSGFWCMQSYLGEPASAPGRLMRIYWSVDCRDVFPVLSRVSTMLGDHRFSLKCSSRAAGFTRVDSLVVYVERAAWADLLDPICAAARQLASHLRPSVPPLTLPLGMGVACAEDPGNGESFGQHRCRLLVPGLRRLLAGGRDDGVAIFVETLRAAGIDPQRPWQSPS
jgi:hypothetical protein